MEVILTKDELWNILIGLDYYLNKEQESLRDTKEDLEFLKKNPNVYAEKNQVYINDDLESIGETEDEIKNIISLITKIDNLLKERSNEEMDS